MQTCAQCTSFLTLTCQRGRNSSALTRFFFSCQPRLVTYAPRPFPGLPSCSLAHCFGPNPFNLHYNAVIRILKLLLLARGTTHTPTLAGFPAFISSLHPTRSSFNKMTFLPGGQVLQAPGKTKTLHTDRENRHGRWAKNFKSNVNIGHLEIYTEWSQIYIYIYICVVFSQDHICVAIPTNTAV